MAEVAGADLLLRGAPVLAGDRWDGDCLAVRSGIVVGRGSWRDVRHLVGRGTRVDDVGGAWLLPGFHDAHVHPVAGGLERLACDLSGLATAQEYVDAVRAHAATLPDGAWVTGGGWSMDAFPGGVPAAGPLDAVCPGRPVYLPNRDHHSAWVSTAALRLAGVDSSTPDPPDGRIERGADGHPTGALHEGAMSLVADHVPAPTEDDLLAGLLEGQRHLHGLGIVGWQDALVGDGLGMHDSLATYVQAQQRGLLTAKTVLALWWDRTRGLDQLDDLRERRRIAAAAGLRATSVKIMLDGVCETRTASVLEPYRDDAGRETTQHGLSFVPADELAAAVTALDVDGFQVHLHALGDRAVRDGLDAIERARAVNGGSGPRHHLAHLQIVSADDVDRFAALGAVANVQALWACRDEQMERLTLPYLGERARSRQYVFGSLLRAGARIACGSDWPVSDASPLRGMEVAVTRREPGAPPSVPPLQPEEALRALDVLRAYTQGSCWVNGLESSSGTLEVGRAADVVAVDLDLLAEPPSSWVRGQVVGTWVDGREVHLAR
jgi:predicted amidohydrolase YtcJ